MITFMNDTLSWAKKMDRVGAYKRKQTSAWLKRTSLLKRIGLTEELLVMESNYNGANSTPLFRSLSKLLEK
jgi:hypothetical protein